jgi:opacity protein-like surface antigen
MWKVVTAALGLSLAAASAFAQDFKPVTINVGGGAVFPMTDLKDEWDTGWNGTIGATFNMNEKFGILADYTYFRMDGPSRRVDIIENPVVGAITNGTIESNHQMHVGTFDLVFHPATESVVGGYVLGGGGIYHRTVQLTSPSVGYTTVCDPFWYVCYPALVPIDQILGDRSSNDFGINIGGGITFGRNAKFYIEARYHYVYGKKIQPTLPSGVPPGTVSPCGSDGCSTSGSYFPLTFGVKW